MTGAPHHRRTAALAAAVVAFAAWLVITGPAVAEPNDGSTVVSRLDAGSLAFGSQFGCALVSDGSVRCWGANNAGQLAQGNTANIGDNTGEVPVAVDLGAGRTARSVSVGLLHACAVLDTAQVRCWGNNVKGQLGQGNTNFVGDGALETTVLVPLPRPAVAVAAGGFTTCAILDTGELHCWGNNDQGQLMQGNVANIGDSGGEHTIKVDLGGRTPLAVSVGQLHVCAIYDDHTLHCWGAGNVGQRGTGQNTSYGDDPAEIAAPPVPLPAGRTAVAVTAGNTHNCAILDDGSLVCWGDATSGALGQGNFDNIGDSSGESTVPVDLGGPVRVATAGAGTTCAVAAAGLRCWGNSFYGQLGQGTILAYGGAPGELPKMLPPINLGGQQVGRDSDGDGVRDAVDACPAVPAAMPNGCIAPAVAPEAVLKGKKVLLNTVLVKKAPSAKCPAKATVSIKTKSKKGTIRVAKLLKTKTVATGCLLKGKVALPAKPKASAKVAVKVSGKKLKTKHLVAVRQ